MPHLPDNLVQFYEDGLRWNHTPEQVEAELAYREAFLRSAQEGGSWKRINYGAIEAAHRERRKVREQAEVLVPSSVYFQRPELESEQIAYKQNHMIPASRSRGRVHGFEFVRQCWEELSKKGFSDQQIATNIIRPWISTIVAWASEQLQPNRQTVPQAPEHLFAAKQRRMLKEAKKVIARSDPAKPHVILQMLNGVTREQLDWLWPGRIPLGKLTLLAGDPGLGKSFVTLDIAARVSRGERWPDNPLQRQPAGKVILMNCEDDLADTIAPRLDKANADDTKILAVEGVSMLNKRRLFSLESDIPRLEEVLTTHRDVRLIVIDPIAGFLGKVDSHNNGEVRGMLAPLADLASRFHVAILTVTHLAKTGGTKAVYRAMGSLAFAAAARAVWAITKDPDNPERRLLLPAKLNLAKDPDGLAYRIDDGRVAWEFNPVKMHADDAFAAETANQKPSQRGSERREAIAWLREHLTDKTLAANEVIEAGQQVGFTDRTLRRAYKAIGIPARKESFDGPWLWRLTPAADQPPEHEDTLDYPDL
jgi:putative DNA primase/helicase